MIYYITSKVNGRASTLPTITFADETGTYGQFRPDTDAVGIASGTALVSNLSGVYSYTFTEGSPAASYTYSLCFEENSVVSYHVGSHAYADVKLTIVMPSTQYHSSEAEVRRLLGKYATNLMIDDDSMHDRDIWEGVLADVDDTMNMFLGQMYSLAPLKYNSWVRRRATTLAINLLSQRRGNSPLFVSKTEQTYSELEAIRDGRFHVPGATVLGFQGPAVRNYLLQNRYKRHPLRVEKSKSTGDTYAGEDIALEPYVY